MKKVIYIIKKLLYKLWRVVSFIPRMLWRRKKLVLSATSILIVLGTLFYFSKYWRSERFQKYLWYDVISPHLENGVPNTKSIVRFNKKLEQMGDHAYVLKDVYIPDFERDIWTGHIPPGKSVPRIKYPNIFNRNLVEFTLGVRTEWYYRDFDNILVSNRLLTFTLQKVNNKWQVIDEKQHNKGLPWDEIDGEFVGDDDPRLDDFWCAAGILKGDRCKDTKDKEK